MTELPPGPVFVREKIVAILAEQALLDPSEVSVDSRLDALGLDSLGLVEAIFAIEETFDIQVPFNANTPDTPAFDLTSVATVIAAVEGLLAQKAA